MVQSKEQNKSAETKSQKTGIWIIWQRSNITIMKTLKKHRIMMHKQNKNISKKKENFKKNQTTSGAKKHNNWIEYFTRGIQQQIWSSIIIKEVKEKSFEITQSVEQKGKIMTQWRKPKELKRLHYTLQYTQHRIPSRREKTVHKAFFECGWKFPKAGEGNGLPDSRSPTDPK